MESVPSANDPYAGNGGLGLYFALARGSEGAPALDMSKYFDTNYHFLAPELAADSGASRGWAGGWAGEHAWGSLLTPDSTPTRCRIGLIATEPC